MTSKDHMAKFTDTKEARPYVGDAIRQALRERELERGRGVSHIILSFLRAVQNDGRWPSDEQVIAGDIAESVELWRKENGIP